ncbi:FkbM family methyltransferase [Agrococcus lahaulensis]|nr:FkbM family methyltransferase [Agrococcus lahaulensis]
MEDTAIETAPDRPERTRARSRLAVAAAGMRAAARLRLVEPEIRGLHHLVRRGDVCFDVGAAYGMYSIPLADLVGPDGAVHSFEPQPRPRALLSAARRATGAGHIRLSDSGMGRTACHLPLVLPVRFGLTISGHAHLADGLATTVPARPGATRRIHVPVTTIDDVCAARSIERVHFITADVEGFEPEVLHGAAAVLERDMPSLLLEIEDRHLARYGRTADEVAALLRERGYAMATWRDDGWQPAQRVVLGTRNYLFRAAA